jgi:hypothetical protein
MYSTENSSLTAWTEKLTISVLLLCTLGRAGWRDDPLQDDGYEWQFPSSHLLPRPLFPQCIQPLINLHPLHILSSSRREEEIGKCPQGEEGVCILDLGGGVGE